MSKTAFRLFIVLLSFTLLLSIVPLSLAQDALSGKIVIWGWNAAIENTLIAAGVLDDFKTEYPDVEVEIVYHSPSELYTALPLALTAGTGACDVCLVESSHLAEFVHLGGLLDLTDRVQPYLDVMNDYRWYDAELDGKYYAMPWDSGPVVLYYRRDVFEAAGLPSEPEAVSELVATWDGYLEACRAIVAETDSYCFPASRANNSARLYEMMLWEAGRGYYDPESGDLIVDSPENVQMLEMLGNFWNEDLVSDAQEWTDPWYADFASLEAPVATFIEASWMDVFFRSWVAPGTEGLWGVAYMPSWTADGPRASNDGGSVFVIPAQSQNPDAAWAFVEFALGRKESQLAMFEVSGFTPALETTYDDPAFSEPDPFFSGQITGEVYVDVVQRVPRAGIYGPDYQMMNGIIALAIQRYATGEVSAEQALADAAAEIQANLE